MPRWLIIAGLSLVVLGVILQFAPGLLGWFGRLPGDINVDTERSRVFVPITSMVLISVILTLLINLFQR
ncbi:DUF2905 domain-containing protein [Hydrocarboniclastica marina]|uniref:DUF2905 domain-containing protein n=1 Tax=Hydrocarboniclastica marina TaxID=2259620 RepID=A0A4P7XHX2_9ALTE|nr:DUF2905 domain-containing protein [Hydrocarboniclastica marina]MAL97565.1 hypothetical protein [Alteromonadaceae bacterium]QCF26659.1 DUF2905 domain-containing protein [Hydrocarboniclastica marina]|tara:strand:+ start:310 stop:516 length:207 start_codon:yes stop_codon:yes gene_type:complete